LLSRMGKDKEKSLGEYIVHSKQKLGAGSFAKVLRGYHKDTGTKVAVKKIATTNLPTKLMNSIESEITTLKSVKHPNILQLFDVYKNKNNTFLVTELCEGGDFVNFMAENFLLGTMEEPLMKRFIFEIASGLKVLHENNFIHRDLKPQNLLLTSSDLDATVKIADFGFARFLGENQLAETLCGSPLYMAPESVLQKGHGSKVDLWSLGVIWYELVYGRPPFESMNSWGEWKQRILHDEILFEDVKCYSKESVELIKKLLERDPKKRLSAAELLEKSYFDEFKEIEEGEIKEEIKEEKNEDEIDLLSSQYLVQSYEIISIEEVPEELSEETKEVESSCILS